MKVESPKLRVRGTILGTQFRRAHLGREAIKAHRECPVDIRRSKCAARVCEADIEFLIGSPASDRDGQDTKQYDTSASDDASAGEPPASQVGHRRVPVGAGNGQITVR